MSTSFKDCLYSALGKAFNSVCLSPQNVSRVLDVHPSSLPFCGYSFIINWLYLKGLSACRMQDEFVLGTGTHFHNILEKYMGEENSNLYGTWFCNSCGSVVCTGLKPKDICPHCGAEYTLRYSELGINYKGIVGHVDTIMQDKNGDFWIVDYKTTTLDKLQQKAQDPGENYKTQIFTYALLVKLQYKIKIKGVCLLFIAKEKPSLENTSTWICLVNNKDTAKVKKILKEAVSLKRALVKAKDWNDIKKLPLHKCSNPYCPICCKEEKDIRKILKNLCEKNPLLLPIIDKCK